MYVCPGCATNNREDAKFCRACGQKRNLDSDSSNSEKQKKNCSRCDRPVRLTDCYCLSCGEKLTAGKAPASKICLTCKHVLPDMAVFCVYCGEYVADKSKKKVPLAELFDDDNPDLSPRYEA